MPIIYHAYPRNIPGDLDTFKTSPGLVHGPWALYGSYCRHAGPILREFSMNGREFQHRSFMVLPRLLARIVVPQAKDITLACRLD